MKIQPKNQTSSVVVRKIVAIGIGAAVFFVLKRFANVPSGFPNTELATVYGFLALLGAIFGPVVAGLAGFIGHALADLVTYGPWWTWIAGSGIVGVLFGWLGQKLPIDQGVFGKKEIAIFVFGQTVAHVIVWSLLAPLGDWLIYSSPVNKVFTQGVIVGISNSVSTAILGTLLIAAYTKTVVKSGSLTLED